MTTKSRARSLRKVLVRPQTFVARFILADLIAKRGEGPLERKRIVYRPKGR